MRELILRKLPNFLPLLVNLVVCIFLMKYVAPTSSTRPHCAFLEFLISNYDLAFINVVLHFLEPVAQNSLFRMEIIAFSQCCHIFYLWKMIPFASLF